MSDRTLPPNIYSLRDIADRLRRIQLQLNNFSHRLKHPDNYQLEEIIDDIRPLELDLRIIAGA